MLRIGIILLALFCTTACERAREWVNPGDDTAANLNQIDTAEGRLVLLAPTSMELVEDVYAGASRGYAYQVIHWLEFGVGSMQFLYGPSLPNANDEVWNNGAFAGARGAHLVILVSLDKLEEVPGLNGPGGQKTNIRATVHMRVVNALGEELWAKTHEAEVEDTNSPKFRSGVGSSRGNAVWNANKKCISALKSWLDSKSDKEEFSKPVAPTPPVAVPAMVKVLVTSDPIGADVLIDGVFKGNTPMELYLPVSIQEIKIERAGYASWSRKLTPSQDLEVKPVLERNP